MHSHWGKGRWTKGGVKKPSTTRPLPFRTCRPVQVSRFPARWGNVWTYTFDHHPLAIPFSSPCSPLDSTLQMPFDSGEMYGGCLAKSSGHPRELCWSRSHIPVLLQSHAVSCIGPNNRTVASSFEKFCDFHTTSRLNFRSWMFCCFCPLSCFYLPTHVRVQGSLHAETPVTLAGLQACFCYKWCQSKPSSTRLGGYIGGFNVC